MYNVHCVQFVYFLDESISSGLIVIPIVRQHVLKLCVTDNNNEYTSHTNNINNNESDHAHNTQHLFGHMYITMQSKANGSLEWGLRIGALYIFSFSIDKTILYHNHQFDVHFICSFWRVWSLFFFSFSSAWWWFGYRCLALLLPITQLVTSFIAFPKWEAFSIIMKNEDVYAAMDRSDSIQRPVCLPYCILNMGN